MAPMNARLLRPTASGIDFPIAEALDASSNVIPPTDYTDSTGRKWRAHVFRSSGTLNFTKGGKVEYLVVAGGGGGASDTTSTAGGGGGAGGLLTNVGGTPLAVSAGVHNVVVGAGGAERPSTARTAGNDGNPSSVFSVSATGGGGGGEWNTNPGRTGGSGGGGGAGLSIGTDSVGGAGVSGQGNNGGNGFSSPSTGQRCGGGGGGAGAAGVAGVLGVGGNGGAGVSSSISGAAVTYAGGGGGAIITGTQGVGGAGGGGTARTSAGQANTGGGGGGGAGGTASEAVGRAGGSGIVIVRYRTPEAFDFDFNNLVLVYDTSLEPENNTISVPLNGTVNCTIDWGDGSSESHTTTGFKTHTYANPGVYVVQISGTMTTLNYGTGTENNKAKLVRCLSFGNVGLTSLNNAFRSLPNFVQCPASLPTQTTVTNLVGAFAFSTQFNDARIAQWNVSGCTSFFQTFRGCTAFNAPIGSWNVSNATGMAEMLRDCAAFNQPLDSWNVGNVSDMLSLFQGATSFNQPIGSWNTASLRQMQTMFFNATSFNQPIGAWNVSNCPSFNSTFNGASSFAQDLSGWDIRKATNMTSMLSGSSWGTANYDAALEAWADLPDTDLTIGTTANTSQAITAFAQQGANTRVTSNGHGLNTGSRVNISGTTSYNGDFNVVAVPNANQFDIAVTFVANDATGTMKHRRSRNVTAGFGANKYSAGAPTTARGVLTTTYDWSITDGGQV
jgi:surface protein